jgi:hypothetical protein
MVTAIARIFVPPKPTSRPHPVAFFLQRECAGFTFASECSFGRFFNVWLPTSFFSSAGGPKFKPDEFTHWIQGGSLNRKSHTQSNIGTSSPAEHNYVIYTYSFHDYQQANRKSNGATGKRNYSSTVPETQRCSDCFSF